jgi:AcrR family transcriptional regulator
MATQRRHATKAEADQALKDRIRDAALDALKERGYAGTSTLEIATRAHVSKRELYTLFRDKQDILAYCVEGRSREMRLPLELPAVDSSAALRSVLEHYGAALLRGRCDPEVLTLYRLALAEVERSPEIAQALDRHGREANRTALIKLLREAQSKGWLAAGDTSEMAQHYFALLSGELQLLLLLRARPLPGEAEIGRRARFAAEALLRLHGK